MSDAPKSEETDDLRSGATFVEAEALVLMLLDLEGSPIQKTPEGIANLLALALGLLMAQFGNGAAPSTDWTAIIDRATATAKGELTERIAAQAKRAGPKH